MRLQGLSLQNELMRRLDEPQLERAEKILIRCQLSKEFEDVGNYEAAQGILGDVWQEVGERPVVDNLDESTQAELFLRVGTLTGFIGQARQIEGAQEKAKDLICESLSRFEALKDTEKEAEALTELGFCYWREGAFDNARATLKTALQKIEDSFTDLKGVATLRLAIVENSASHFQDALQLLKAEAGIFLNSTSHVLRGKYHMNLAIFLKNASLTEKGTDNRDKALIEFAAASYHLQQAGHARYLARSENNLGFMCFTMGNYSEAHEHLDRAHRLFTNLKETSNFGQVDETRSRAFLAEGRVKEAVVAARRAVTAQEKGDEQGLLAQALTTYGIALARADETDEAKRVLSKAVKSCSLLDDKEGEARTQLAMIEELADCFNSQKLFEMYRHADSLVGQSKEPEILCRLRASAGVLAALEYRQRRVTETPEFIYASDKIGNLLEQARIIAKATSAVLLTGESGTGKEVLAQLIHSWSERRGELIDVNCSNLTDSLLEAQLFGHRKGSFTDATEDALGLAMQAAGGTLFLDEIGELSLGNQARVLRLIDNREVLAIGAQRSQSVDIRIVAATNRNLKEMVKEKLFREDLFYRLSAFHLEIPPLRERPEDITQLAQYLIDEAVNHHKKNVVFTDDAIAELRILPLKGNVRELRLLIERAVILSRDGARVEADDIRTTILRNNESVSFANAWSGCSLDSEVIKFEKDLIMLALKAAEGHVTRAAQLLGISHQNLLEKLKGRHKDLMPARIPAKRRNKSIMRQRNVAV